MSLAVAILIVVAATGIAITAMLWVRRKAPDGSYFNDGDRAAGVFGVLATGFAVLLGFVVFLAFTSYDSARAGAESEARIVAQQVEIRAGDAVLFHTGWGALYGRDNEQFLSGEPGPGLDVVRWLYAKRIAVTGADTWSYGPVPGEDPARPFLVPQTMYTKLGLFGLENLKTEELAEKRVYEFLFVLTHAKTRGSTAAVVAPAAVY